MMEKTEFVNPVIDEVTINTPLLICTPPTTLAIKF
jgi:hypothetical protein